MAIIDFHFKPVGRQRRQLNQSAADNVVTPIALAAADMGAGHHARCKRRSAANAKVAERVNSAIKVEQRDFSPVDRDYCRLPMVRSSLRSHFDESGLAHQRQHGVISLSTAPGRMTNKQNLTPEPCATQCFAAPTTLPFLFLSDPCAARKLARNDWRVPDRSALAPWSRTERVRHHRTGERPAYSHRFHPWCHE